MAVSPASSLLANRNTGQSETGLVFDKIYLDHWIEPGHPESPKRLVHIMRELEQTSLSKRIINLKPATDVLPYIYLIHTREHVSQIKSRYGYTHDVAVAVAGGVITAVQEVCKGKLKNAFCATRPPGHHAINSGREEGFCFYNAVAVGARYAQTEYNFQKILIVDWDYHHGNGTEAVFYNDPSVLYFSTHDFYAYPGTGDPARRGEGAGEGYNINVHLDCSATDDDIINAFKEKLLPAVHQFKPDLILVSAGFDSREDDLLGCFQITDTGYVELTRMLMALADDYCNGRIVSVLEGGYNPVGLAKAVIAHITALETHNIKAPAL